MPRVKRRRRWRLPRRRHRSLAAERLEERLVLTTFTVNSVLDTVDVAPGDGVAEDAAGNTTLRAAIMESNALAGSDTINLPAATYTLTIAGADEDAAATGDLDLTDLAGVTITGAGRDTTIIDGNQLDRVFHILGSNAAGTTVSLSHLTITGGLTSAGYSAGNGAGIRSAWTALTVHDSIIRNNRTGSAGSFGGYGGGIYTVGQSLTVTESIITENLTGDSSAGGNGGGISANNVFVTVRDSVISNNRTGDGTSFGAGRGGGIETQSGDLTVINSTISGNVAGNTSLGSGGGIYSNDTFVMQNSVVLANTAAIGGGIFIADSGVAEIVDSTISNNTTLGGGGGSGLYNHSGIINLISGTTVSGNQDFGADSTFDGGAGIRNGGYIATIVNSTISGNVTDGRGGGLNNQDDIDLILNTTIADNTAAEGGGVVNALSSSTIADLYNTIIADNIADSAPDLLDLGEITGVVLNLVENGEGNRLGFGQDPKLGPLADNGGPTWTHALLLGSPAIDAGGSHLEPATDQRGVPRPQGPRVDIGAFELVLANNDPTAVDDVAATRVDVAVTVDVLANDSDPDGDPLTVSSVSLPANGTATVNGDNTVTYTPTLGFLGTDSFDYTIDDGNGGSATATVTVTVTPNSDPVAVDDLATTDEDVLLSIDVLINDSDAEGDSLTVSSVTDPPSGAVAINADNTLTYTPDLHFNGTDSFDYTIDDGWGGAATATVTVTVTSVNDDPAAADDAATTDEDVAVTIGVLVNDSDVDGDPLTVSSVTDPPNGSVVINPDNTVTYTPGPDFNGIDSFDYTIDDGQGGTGTATVTVSVAPVNDAPVARDDAYAVDEDQTLTLPGDPISLLFLDSDPDDWVGQGLTQLFTTDDGTFRGERNFDKGVRITFRGPDHNWELDFAAPFDATVIPGLYENATRWPFQAVDDPGLDVFGDGRGCNTLSGEFEVFQASYGPTGNVLGFAADFVQHCEGDDPALRGSILFQANLDGTFGVLLNDSDVDGDDLRVTVVTGPSHGRLVLNPNGSFDYTPDPDFNGTDSFTYLANDGSLDSNVATVTIDVNPVADDPVAQDDLVATAEDTAVTIEVLANDSDPDGDSLSVSAVTDPASGSVVVNADETLTYTPDADFNGTDSFDYTIDDGNGGTSTATVTVTVSPVNDAPLAVDDAAVTLKDAAVTIDVLANDSDVDGDTLAISSLTDPASGSVVVNVDETVTYTPNPDFSGTDTFDYTIDDGNGGTSTATVTVTVDPGNPFNNDPVAEDDTATTDEDAAVTIDVLVNDSDLDGDPLTINALADPAHGSVVVGADDTVTYTPEPDFNGTDSFEYTVIDGQGGADTATVRITVAPVNDDPVAVDDPVTTDEDVAVTVDVLVNDSDVDGDPLSLSAVSDPVNGGSVVINADATVTYTPPPNFNGVDSFDYTIDDGQGGADTATVRISIASVNDPPVALDDGYAVNEDQTLTVQATTLLFLDSDPGDYIGQGLTQLFTTDDGTFMADRTFDNGVAIFFGGSGHSWSLRFTAPFDATLVPGTYDNAARWPFQQDDQPGLDISGDSRGCNKLSGSFEILQADYRPNGDVRAFAADFVQHCEEGDPALRGSVRFEAVLDGVFRVLRNDTDVEDDDLTATLVSGPSHGTLGFNPDGSFDYTPNPDFYGTDSFTYLANDGNDDSNVATVTIDVNPVNDDPLAVDDAVTTDEDAAVVIDVLANDSNPDGDPLTVTMVTDPANGTAAINADSTVTYTPDPDFNGSDSFDYTFDNGGGVTSTATVTVTVNPINDAPTAVDDAFDVLQGGDLSVAAPGLLANDDDGDGDAITAVLVTGPSNGTLDLNADGSFTYTPDPDFLGSDSFAYMANDGSLDSNVATVTLDVDVPGSLRTGVVAVGSDAWTTVTLDHDYGTGMVVLATANYDGSSAPLVVRIQNAENDSFDVRVDRADGSATAVTGVDVYYTVVVQGVYTVAEHGVTMEAGKFTSTVTDAKGSWVGQTLGYSNTYTNPVVVGQVMTYNDPDYSVFWAGGADPKSPPSASALLVGKHVGEDPDTTRADETIGYLVIEAGTGTLGSLHYTAAVGAETVRGMDNAPPFSYALSGLTSVSGAAVSLAGMNGGDGGWTVLYGPSSVTPGGLNLVVDEDQIGDLERGHTTEQAAYLVFGTAAAPADAPLETGTLSGVTNTGWTTVTLGQSYTSMVVVGSANYDNASVPLVVRIRNAADDSFEVRVDRADGLTDPVSGVTVHYTVVEEGVYTSAVDGVTMEAVKFTSTVTDAKGNWLGESRSYANTYTNPVVVGQVMTYNDPDFSVFWAGGATPQDPPSADALLVGKHVGEDADTTRADETIGYIVIEAGTGSLGSLAYVAGVGPEVIRGFDNAPPYGYALAGLSSASSAAVSLAGMNGGDGGWAVLYGPGALAAASLNLAVDEDQIGDTERGHTTEQAAYLIFGSVDAPSEIVPLETGTVSGVTNTGWTTVTLGHAYTSMVVVASANYDNTSVPLVVRIRNAAADTFDVRVDRADGLTDPVSGVVVHYIVVEEGVYTSAVYGVTMEAVKFTSTVTDAKGSWLGESRSYGNTYVNPAVVGQVMTYNDAGFSVFWASGASSGESPSGSALRVGKHVGEDTDTSRADETIGYIVIESGTGSVGSLQYSAGLGADTVRGVDDAPPYSYGLAGLTSAGAAVVSQAGMNGGNGGWAVLYGSSPVSASSVNLAVDEDRIADFERAHTTEQIAYVVFGSTGTSAASLSAPVTAPLPPADDVAGSSVLLVPPSDSHETAWGTHAGSTEAASIDDAPSRSPSQGTSATVPAQPADLWDTEPTWSDAVQRAFADLDPPALDDLFLTGLGRDGLDRLQTP